MAHVPVEERRRALIEAAAKVIAREGVGRASTRRIAEMADANLAALHYSFRNKDELFAGVLESSRQSLDEVVQADSLPGSAGLVPAVQALVEGYVDSDAATRDLYAAQYELILWSLRTERARALSPRIYTELFAAFEQVLRDARSAQETSVDLPKLAKLVVATLDGLNLQVCVLGTEALRDLDFRAIAEGLVTAASPRARRSTNAPRHRKAAARTAN